MSSGNSCNSIDASLGIIGGSGLFGLIDNAQFIEIDTPYGKPSDKIEIIQMANKVVAFLPRHGSKNNIMPRNINYRANIWALHHLGIKRIISFCVAGSLRKSICPGDFLICDDIINQTKFRDDTFYGCGNDIYIYMDNVFCSDLRKLAFQVISSKEYRCHETGTMVVIDGPRFATKAESKVYINNKCDVINMTQYPECYLAKELNMCYASIVLISDYDIGVLMERPGERRGGKTYDALYDIFAPICPRTLANDVLDIVFLNDAPLELRFHVIRYGRIIFDTDTKKRGEFKEQTIEEYCDYRPILNMFDRAILASL